MSVTCYFSGRLGNVAYNIAMLVAYAKKYSLQYYIPTTAVAYNHFGCSIANPLPVQSTGPAPINPQVYTEPNMTNGNPYYHDIPRMDNVMFNGYYQSFLYFNDYRQDVLDIFNFPHEIEYGVTSISVRRGDNVTEDRGNDPTKLAFPIAPVIYYHRAVEYMLKRGHKRFRLYSDDIPWCKQEFTSENYPGATFEFSEGKSELEDYISLTQCEHNITARSTFSLTAAWLNQNPNKIVLVPQENMWWKGQNRNLLTGSGFTQIFFPQEYNEHMIKYTYDYNNISFKLIIQNYWKDIYRGQEREQLYHDYRVMLDRVQQVDKSRYILDIGANHGIFSIPASLLGYKVIALEPVEVNHSSIELAIRENKCTTIDLYRLALSDTDGELIIYVPECSDNSSLSSTAAVANMTGKSYIEEVVPTARFDTWITDHPQYRDIGLIKLDVQGAEYKILDGMREFLTQAHDITIICEYEHHLNTMGYTYQQLDQLLISYGFQDRGHITGGDKLFYKP